MSTAATISRSVRPSTAPSSGKRLSLTDAMKVGKGLPSRVVFHAQSGIGKTSFAAYSPSPYFLLSRGETGLQTLIDNGLIPETPHGEANSLADVTSIIEELTSTDHGYKTLVIDVMDGIEQLAKEHVCLNDFKNNWSEAGFEGFQRGYKVTANTVWRELLVALDKMREIKRMGIICLCHTGVANFADPAGPDYNRFVPTLFKGVWELTQAWADIVLFGYREVVATKDKGDRKAKGRGGSSRMSQTEYDAVADAKNRHNLPSTISMGDSGKEAWENFVSAIKEGKRKDGE